MRPGHYPTPANSFKSSHNCGFQPTPPHRPIVLETRILKASLNDGQRGEMCFILANFRGKLTGAQCFLARWWMTLSPPSPLQLRGLGSFRSLRYRCCGKSVITKPIRLPPVPRPTTSYHFQPYFFCDFPPFRKPSRSLN